MKIAQLVRDRVTNEIHSRGEIPKARTLTGTELREAIEKKLFEETAEIVNASDERLADEAADLLEVLDAYLTLRGVSIDAVKRARRAKATRLGTFQNGTYLISTEPYRLAPGFISEDDAMTILAILANSDKASASFGLSRKTGYDITLASTGSESNECFRAPSIHQLLRLIDLAEVRRGTHPARATAAIDALRSVSVSPHPREVRVSRFDSEWIVTIDLGAKRINAQSTSPATALADARDQLFRIPPKASAPLVEPKHIST